MKHKLESRLPGEIAPLSPSMCALRRCSSPARSVFPLYPPPGYPCAASACYLLPSFQVPCPATSHRQHYAFPQEACTPPSVLGTWPLPSVWNLQDSSLGMSLQGHTEAKLTSKDKEEQQHDGVEESQDEAEDILVDHC